MTEIYLHIVARMADYMATHPQFRTRQFLGLGLPRRHRHYFHLPTAAVATVTATACFHKIGSLETMHD